jgi:hypothetical protein
MRAMLTGALLDTPDDPPIPVPDAPPDALPADLLNSAAINAWVDRLSRFDRDVSDAERIDQLRALERLKSAAAAAQARITVDLDSSIRAGHAATGMPTERQGRGVAHPERARQHSLISARPAA